MVVVVFIVMVVVVVSSLGVLVRVVFCVSVRVSPLLCDQRPLDAALTTKTYCCCCGG